MEAAGEEHGSPAIRSGGDGRKSWMVGELDFFANKTDLNHHHHDDHVDKDHGILQPDHDQALKLELNVSNILGDYYSFFFFCRFLSRIIRK